MSEQLQNQHIPTPEELQARDDAIFNTVEDFRNELDNPAQPQVPEFSDVAAHDAENKPVDVDAIFDNRKAEISQPGTGRHRKAFDEEQNMNAIKEIAVFGKTRGKHAGAPAEHREAYGMTAMASSDDIARRRNGAAVSFEGMSLEEAEEAARKMPRHEQTQGLLAPDYDELPSGTGPRSGVNSGISAEEAADMDIDEDDASTPTSAAPAPATPATPAPSRARIIGDGGLFRGTSEASTTPEARAERYVQVGEANIPARYRSDPEYPSQSGDAVLVDQKGMLVSVMDGMGGHGGKEGLDAKAAAELNDLVEERFAHAPQFKSTRQAEKFMAATLLECHRAMEAYDDGRGAAGAIVKTVEVKGQLYAVSGIVGDVAVYVRNPGEEQPQQIGMEQVNVNKPSQVLNAFGGSLPYDEKALAQRMRSQGLSAEDVKLLLPHYTNQVVTTPIQEGATIAVFSDGIAGDKPEDRLSDHDLKYAFSQPSAQTVADEFISLTRFGKNDDKGVGVIRIGERIADSDTDWGTFEPDTTTPDVVTPRARRRDRIAARLGSMIDTEQIRGELGESSSEIVDSWRQLRENWRSRRSGTAATGKLAMMAAGVRSGASRAVGTAKELGTAAKSFGNYAADLAYRKPADQLTDKERKARPYAKGLAIANGALVVSAAVLGANQLLDNGSAEATPTSSSSPSVEASQPAYGPQAPKASETPTPSASATKKATPKPSTKPTVAGPTAIPTTPDFSNKPHVEEPQGPASTAEKQQTKDLDHETISFTTKDGKVVSATAKLKSGGSIFEAGHDAGLTDTQVANAVNKAGITGQQAEQLPVGQQIDFTQQADGSYVVHLR